MIRIGLTALIVCTISAGCYAGADGNIGLVDNRSYGSLEDPLYSAIGRISIGCTAGFIDANLVHNVRALLSGVQPARRPMHN